ncbi:MAG: hypothetical protein BWY31_04552 [Lentisphaerae bacterium ADurb.Bin242]|nr:MAG: hypothetical protein BWY31_04552 [Lentisphaerae bacterium ADurb.Bin242]
MPRRGRHCEKLFDPLHLFLRFVKTVIRADEMFDVQAIHPEIRIGNLPLDPARFLLLLFGNRSIIRSRDALNHFFGTVPENKIQRRRAVSGHKFCSNAFPFRSIQAVQRFLPGFRRLREIADFHFAVESHAQLLRRSGERQKGDFLPYIFVLDEKRHIVFRTAQPYTIPVIRLQAVIEPEIAPETVRVSGDFSRSPRKDGGTAIGGQDREKVAYASRFIAGQPLQRDVTLAALRKTELHIQRPVSRNVPNLFRLSSRMGKVLRLSRRKQSART